MNHNRCQGCDRRDAELIEVTKEKDAALLQISEARGIIAGLLKAAEDGGLSDSASCRYCHRARIFIAATHPQGIEKRNHDKSGGDAARCGKCGKFYVDHADDETHG